MSARQYSNHRIIYVKMVIAFMVFPLVLNGCTGLKSKVIAPPESKIVTPNTIDGFSSPESIIAEPSSGRFFVSNVGEKLEPGAKDNDGFISELSSDGVILTKRFLPKTGSLHAPKGMAIIGQTLFVTDIDRVVGFDLVTQEQKLELDFSSEHTMFLNDLTVFDDHTLFVSATDISKIYRISLDDPPKFTIIAENILGANGLFFDRKSQNLFVVGFGEGFKGNGELGVISFQDNNPKYQRLTGQLGALDGVALLSDSRLIFSDWVAFDKPGLLRVYDLKTKELSVINLSEEARGPADFFYDEKNSNLWLPKMLEGKVLVEMIR